MPFTLSVHAAYRCRDSGACCTSGWAIPVEVPVHRTLEAALAGGRLRTAALEAGHPFAPGPASPEFAGVLATDERGACVFHDAAHRRCAIHAALGAGAKPAACRAFPRIVVQDPRGTMISLSHYCPSALDLLFTAPPLRIVEHPAVSEPEALVEGLDARDALPPELREDALVDWDSLTAWDRFALAVFERAEAPEAALDRLWAGYGALRAWRPRHGPLLAWVERLGTDLDDGPSEAGHVHARADARQPIVRAVEAAVPRHLRPPSRLVPGGGDEDDRVAPAWRRGARPLCRYLAARAFACWPLYQGRGLSTQIVYLEAVLAVTKAQARAHAARRDAPLDEAGLRDAIRHADLLLVHLADPDALARGLDDAGMAHWRERA